MHQSACGVRGNASLMRSGNIIKDEYLQLLGFAYDF